MNKLLINFILSIVLAYNFDKTETNYQFVEHYELLPDSVSYTHLTLPTNREV